MSRQRQKSRGLVMKKSSDFRSFIEGVAEEGLAEEGLSTGGVPAARNESEQQ